MSDSQLTSLKLAHLHRAAHAGVAEPWLLVLLHGVGSNEADLFGLAQALPPHWHVLSLRGPVTLQPGAYAWFEVQFAPQGPRINETQERASRALLAEQIAQAAAQLGVPAARVVVGGFSQGGIMGLSLLLTQPALLHAGLVMHSRLLEQVEPLIAAPAAFTGKHLWVSAGLQDPVIAVTRAQAIRDRVKALPLRLSYHEFPGGHEIRGAEQQAMRGWLAEVSGQA